MHIKPKVRIRLSDGSNMVLGFAVALAMLLLFARMVAFVAGHGHH